MEQIMKIKQILIFKALLMSSLANAGLMDTILNKLSYFTAPTLKDGINGFADDYAQKVEAAPIVKAKKQVRFKEKVDVLCFKQKEPARAVSDKAYSSSEVGILPCTYTDAQDLQKMKSIVRRVFAYASIDDVINRLNQETERHERKYQELENTYQVMLRENKELKQKNQRLEQCNQELMSAMASYTESGVNSTLENSNIVRLRAANSEIVSPAEVASDLDSSFGSVDYNVIQRARFDSNASAISHKSDDSGLF
jgi:hypothetical protein